MSIVIVDQVRKFLVGPIESTLDLLNACIHIWVCLIHPSIKNSNFNWCFGWLCDVLLIDILEPSAPIPVIDTPVLCILTFS